MPEDIREFESFSEFLAWLENTRPSCQSLHECASRDNNAHFRGTKNWEDAVRLATLGWDEGTKEVAKFSSPIIESIGSKIQREDIYHDVEGIGIDIGRYLDGEPECWQRIEETTIEGKGNKILKLAFNITGSGGITHDVLIARGGAVAALIELLEYAGCRVEIWGMFRSEDYSGEIEARIRLKQADQNIDMPHLAFALAHPSMLRRLGFAFIERMPANLVKSKVSGSYGSPRESAIPRDIYIGAAVYGERQWSSPESAQAWIISKLKEQGVTLRED